MIVELKVGFKNNTVSWSLDETLHLIKNYKLMAYKELNIKRTTKMITRKVALIKLKNIIRKTRKKQVKINNKICNYIKTICNYYNKNKRLNLNYINKIPKKYRTIVENSFPKAIYGIINKQTEVFRFIEENKRMPSAKAISLRERRLFHFVNMRQYNKTDYIFINKLEEVKFKNSILSKLGEKKPRVDQTIVKLISWIKNNKRMPNTRSANIKERKLAHFFNASCNPNGLNFKKELVVDNIDILTKYMEGNKYYNSKNLLLEMR